jgi:hypothetical protein
MKINIGDILAIELKNKLYMFLHIIYQIPRKNKREIEKISPKSHLFDYIKWYPGFYIINIFKQISKDMILKDREIMFKGVFVMGSDLKESNYTKISEEKINIEEIEFPETLGANKEDGYFIQKGELKILIKNYPQEFETELQEGPPTGFNDIYSLGDSVLYFQNRKDEMQRKYFDGWKYYPSDLKYYPKLRNRIYEIIKEDPKQNYYNMALKYGFDLRKLY